MKIASLYITRHGAAVQSPMDPFSASDLSYDELAQIIESANMTNSLLPHGRLQAAWLGEYLHSLVVSEGQNEVDPLCVIGPFRRHQETFQAARRGLFSPRMQTMTDERLAERSRGELDASLWPTSRLEIERPAEAMRKAAYPAAWKPPQGESYADVNHRLKHLLKDIAARKIPRQPTILFTSREVALASLAESGLGYMSDQDFITGLKGEHGDSISTLRLENAGIVAYHDLKGAGHFTHFEIHQPVWQKDGSIVNDPIVMRTGKLSLPKHR